jgi:hypothetical protein
MTKLALALLLTLISAAAAGAQPRIIATVATGTSDAAVFIPGTQYGAFAVAAVNVWHDMLQVDVHVAIDGGPRGALLCETDRTGACLTSFAQGRLPSILFPPGVVKTFSVFPTTWDVETCNTTSGVGSSVLSVSFGEWGRVYVPVVVDWWGY